MRAIATNTNEINKDMCDTQNKFVVDHIKNDAKKVNCNQIFHNFSKDTRHRNNASLMDAPKLQVVMEILNSNNKNFASS